MLDSRILPDIEIDLGVNSFKREKIIIAKNMKIFDCTVKMI